MGHAPRATSQWTRSTDLFGNHGLIAAWCSGWRNHRHRTLGLLGQWRVDAWIDRRWMQRTFLVRQLITQAAVTRDDLLRRRLRGAWRCDGRVGNLWRCRLRVLGERGAGQRDGCQEAEQKLLRHDPSGDVVQLETTQGGRRAFQLSRSI